MNTVIAGLVQRIQQGEEALITQLWEKFRPLWTKWSKTYTFCGYDEEDFTQQSFLILVETLRKFDHTLGVPFEGYYHLALRRWGTEQMRRGDGTPLADLALYAEMTKDERIDIEGSVVDQLIFEELWQEIGALPAEDQQIIRGYYLEYKTLGELADLLHTSYKSIERKKSRLLLTIRKKLQKK